MRALVTGSAGFVGSYLVPKLKAAGFEVYGIDTVDEKQSDVFIKHDLTQAYTQELPRMDVCIHLASSVGGIIFNISQMDILEVNAKINESAVALCKASSCDKFVFFSTINVFENDETYTHRQLTHRNQSSKYAISKANGEKYFESRFKNLMVIRPTNLFGKNQLRRHEGYGESHVIPDLLKKIDSSNDLEVFGDGSQIRNFLHVSDVVDFVITNLGFEGWQYFNLRSNNTISIKLLVEELLEYRNKPMTIQFKPEFLKYEILKIRNFDISVPLSKGFKASVSSVKAGLSF